jgi:hypothetical protein
MYVLKPCYGDLKVVVLGSRLSQIIKALERHFEDILDFEEDYESCYITQIKQVLKSKTIEELKKNYSLLNEDYKLETA